VDSFSYALLENEQAKDFRSDRNLRKQKPEKVHEEAIEYRKILTGMVRDFRRNTRSRSKGREENISNIRNRAKAPKTAKTRKPSKKRSNRFRPALMNDSINSEHARSQYSPTKLAIKERVIALLADVMKIRRQSVRHVVARKVDKNYRTLEPLGLQQQMNEPVM